jgi:ferric-dicitrate binding protein FerR (iron transport regulator)
MLVYRPLELGGLGQLLDFPSCMWVEERRENFREVELLSRKWKEEGLSLDEISRGLANDTITRRRALAVLAATAVGAMIPFARVEAQPGCRRRGHPCTGVGNRCCRNLECRRGVCRPERDGDNGDD